jgi:hypothetical protein
LDPQLGGCHRQRCPWHLHIADEEAGVINTNKFTASTNGTLDVYLREKSAKGFYYVSFRVPGANSGTP